MNKTNPNSKKSRHLSQSGNERSIRAVPRIPYITSLLFSLGLAALLSFNWISLSSAQDAPGFIRNVRILELDRVGIQNPVGLAFSQNANAFHVLETHKPSQPPFGQTDINLITAVEKNKGSARISASITDPINAAFDNQYNRLLIYQPNSDKLIIVDANADGSLNPGSLTRFDASEFSLQDPQGMAVNPANGDLFILDSAVPQILHIEPEVNGSYEGSVIHQIGLQQIGSNNMRGLAFDPVTANLHLFNPGEGNLYEITTGGQVVGYRDLSPFNIENPQAMVFAPSADQTDDPAVYNLYLADSGSPALDEQTFNSLESDTEDLAVSSKQQDSGEILELSFNQVQAAQSASFTGLLVNTIEAWKFNPPSPDTSGITYLSNSNSLLMSDSEVNEMPIYAGANVFRTNLSGNNLSETFTTLSFSNEPTGVSVNPSNQHLFFSDDTGDRSVYELNPGPDGTYETADDVVTSFLTETFNPSSMDPEGVAFDPSQGVIFVVDGVNAEVYRVSPGANGLFDGEPPAGDDQVTNFDTAQHGITDPEGITINPFTGNLYIVGRPVDTLAELTNSGDLVQTIDISAANAVKPAGLVYAPSSQNPSEWNIYIAARGVDNNSDPNENDGEVYELTMPPSGPAPPTANDDIASTILDTPVIIDVAANDSDPNGNLDPASANTDCNPTCSETTNGTLVNNGDGTFTYTPDVSFVGEDNFVYEICDTDPQCDTAAVTITVGGATIEVRISASSDDSEERVDGNPSLTSSDLELVFDSGGDQTVGLRFNGVNIPQGANITKAYVQFQSDETNTGVTTLTIEGEDVDNASIFVDQNWDITSRPKTTAAVPWSPPDWNTRDQAGPDQQTPDISSIIQEIVDRPGWTPTNSLVIIISGTGERTAEAYDGVPAAAPLLHVEYASGGSNTTPQVTINSPLDAASFNVGDAIDFAGTANDSEEGDLTANLSWESDIDGPIGSGGSFSYSNLSSGVHTITAFVTDTGGKTGSASVGITIISNPPLQPVLVAPADGATGIPTIQDLEVIVSDPDNDELTVTFYGRPTSPASGSDFSIIVIPDTQHYTDDPANYANFSAQTQWIVDNKDSLNIKFVTHLGDIVQNGNNNGNDAEWLVADAAMGLLEDPLTTLLADGIPYGVTLGNHDYGTGGAYRSEMFNNFFGVDRFQGRAYYGGSYDPLLNDNNFELFSAEGYDFIIIHIEYDDTLDPGVLPWADNLLKTYGDRRAIAVTHALIDDGNPGPWNPQGQALYDELKDNPNLFLMLGGHHYEEGQREDVFIGNTVYSLLSDYQWRTNGGDGWLRILEFSPANNEIRVKTYSPVLDQYETDANSQFNLFYDMGVSNFQIIGTNTNVPSGSNTSTTWSGLADNTEYEWYVTVDDGFAVTTGSTWTFTTESTANTPPTAVDDSYSTDEDVILNMAAPGVLGNDSDADLDPLSAVLNTDVSNGNLILNTDGSFSYTPNANFNGSDSFTYTANDGFALSPTHRTRTSTAVTASPTQPMTVLGIRTWQRSRSRSTQSTTHP
jgi:hypothetical protein